MLCLSSNIQYIQVSGNSQAKSVCRSPQTALHHIISADTAESTYTNIPLICDWVQAASDSVPMVSAAAIEALTAPCAGGPRPWAVLAGSDREAARAAVQAAAKHDTVSLRATAARAAGAFAACSPPNTASDATGALTSYRLRGVVDLCQSQKACRGSYDHLHTPFVCATSALSDCCQLVLAHEARLSSPQAFVCANCKCFTIY